MKQVVLTAPDIACDHCVMSIRKAVTNLPGVEFVSGDPASKQVSLRFDESRVKLEDIEQAMEDEGYPVVK
ncbi:MAG TPA: heavy-metal-associated domain-containing protein [Dehalococcoidia bacterium]|nr:heavy-metal-associated domain-containing protein [Dehalococcoidia bacterium]